MWIQLCPADKGEEGRDRDQDKTRYCYALAVGVGDVRPCGRVPRTQRHAASWPGFGWAGGGQEEDSEIEPLRGFFKPWFLPWKGKAGPNPLCLFLVCKLSSKNLLECT
jgi:hypothetical protein